MAKSGGGSGSRGGGRLGGAARTGLLLAYHPSRGGIGNLRVSQAARPSVNQLVESGYGSISDGIFRLNRRGITAAQRLIDRDAEASSFYFSVGRN